MPMQIMINQVAQWLTTAFLFLIATGAVFEATAGTFTVALTTFMFLGFVAYFSAVNTLLHIGSKDEG